MYINKGLNKYKRIYTLKSALQQVSGMYNKIADKERLSDFWNMVEVAL